MVSIDLRFVCLATVRVLPKEKGVDQPDEKHVFGGLSASPATGRECFISVAAKAGVDELVKSDEDLLPVGWPKEKSDDE